MLTTPDAVPFQKPKFSPDGTVVIATGNRVPKLGQLHLPGPEPVIWDATTGQKIGRLPADNQKVLSQAFAPDGATTAGGFNDGRIRLLAFSGLDRVVQLWDTSTWQLVGSVPGFSSAVRDIDFSPDGATMVTASGIRRFD